MAQLARSIGAIMRGEWLGANQEFDDVDAFFPVLLVHNSRLDTPCMAAFLNEDFMRLLGEVPARKSVRPLIVLTMLDHESSRDKRTLFAFLKAYDDACPDRVMSFHNLLATSPLADEIRPSEHLVGQSEVVMDLLLDRLFPKAGA